MIQASHHQGPTSSASKEMRRSACCAGHDGEEGTWPFLMELNTDPVGFEGRICILFVFGPPKPSTVLGTWKLLHISLELP